ncbi:3-hydroxyacyl-ACP dehydratase FabZ [Sporolactobacillus nakayamae]|uniref:3-hydroxyacyl-[acyl-carrier-protein] dehydratase FabZ n=1 Tax=Sporolactobacillus nakayamae TaxID=269670 RepID=A0A1I2SA80_9BACL|nr:3-hydroxyacyl-ACP dehydratase FabZ [Sporolactobacillus nakayamae]SFG49680.1 3-hydroxyacyl-[acyl-carrier-protein] dehydratase [Sporolactobacillus nakayamae]
MLTIDEIKKILPHRYPFLLVDKVLEVEDGKKAVGIKNVTVNEPFFQGHFPDYPVMPGVLIVEALAQVSGIAVLSKGKQENMLTLYAGIDKCRFKRQVRPGDQLKLEAEILRFRAGFAKAKGVATVDGEVACEAEMMFALKAAE